MKLDFEIHRTNNRWRAVIDGAYDTEFMHSVDRFLDSLLGVKPCRVPVTLLAEMWSEPGYRPSGYDVDFWYRGMLSGDYAAYEVRQIYQPMSSNGCLMELCAMIMAYVPEGNDFRVVFPLDMVIPQKDPLA